jgi:hypothetical protein
MTALGQVVCEDLGEAVIVVHDEDSHRRSLSLFMS